MDLEPTVALVGNCNHPVRSGMPRAFCLRTIMTDPSENKVAALLPLFSFFAILL